MDQGTAYIAGKLDQVLDRQRDLADMMRQILATQAMSKPAAQSSKIFELLQHPRLWWGLLVAALAAAQVPLEQAIKIASSMP